MGASYKGRFAPSPTGPLHAGSLVAALASWLDARARGGQWLVRMEDVDLPRCVPGADQRILQQLADCGLIPDEPPVWQSQRSALYQQALDALIQHGLAYPCACSRKDIEQALLAQGLNKARHGELVYPGTCRTGLHGKEGRAWRFATEDFGSSAIHPIHTHIAKGEASIAHSVTWTDRRLGPQTQDVAAEVGDFVLKRADGLFAYQLAVVVDDAAQGITHIVRGEDLADNTARQILLQRALGYRTPEYLHTELVLAADRQKLSKQNGAQALDTSSPEAVLGALTLAANRLGLTDSGTRDNRGIALAAWVEQWRATLQSQNT
ncbi:tRNA glutamyl-Q(34) synthetase GluQRS [Rhodoferax lacus]|uniref:Glutamyl-Q tRNA(Asp) synthetase n=1 Tax=Rhodoferax lacus TaxID=2184758 RepID=A0A3E1RIS8_9BURK|nr:tRNA glutamyl-Q(34) synthetase GluQRS [Rhodoferax lacus]RFO98902.1 tRNA glutamyl-Q(34) synthetase GluQRS [Rhodoferax lacus]